MGSDAQNVDPWLLAHGLIFVLNYSVLMPVACFIIYYNRDRFYQLHCILGIVIIVLLVAGWASLAGASRNKSNGLSFSPMSETSVARSHSVTGIVARFVAVVVCVIGVVLGVLKMPKHVRTVVRISHGVGGILISLFGPAVVWNGYVRLRPFIPPISLLDTTPVVWYSAVLSLLILTGWLLFKRKKSAVAPKHPDPQSDIEIAVPWLSIPDTVGLIRSDTEGLFVFFGDQVVRIPRNNFEHPGGLDVIKAYEGKDISGVFSGLEGFPDSGRQRFHQHSVDALRLLMSMRVGRVSGPNPFAAGDSSTIVGGTRLSVDESFQGGIPMFSIDEEGRSIATLVEATKINTSNDFPVVRFSFEISDFVLLSSLTAGMKVRLSLPDNDVERTYTVVSFDHITRRVDLVIKIYAAGSMTSRLRELKCGDEVFFSSLTYPPFPQYMQDPQRKELLLVAGGTGIVPLMYYMERAQSETRVFWSLRHRTDVFFIDDLEMVLAKKPNVRLYVFLTRDEACSLGFSDKVEVRSGRIEIPILARPAEAVAVMSGPAEFVRCIHKHLIGRIGISADRILSLD